MKKCPFFGICGGCKFDFTSPDYQSCKQALIEKIPATHDPTWIEPGGRRRADFAFLDNKFGFYQAGSKNVVPVDSCPQLCPEINALIPQLAMMPWVGAGSVLVTLCDNGIDLSVTSTVPYFSPEFKRAVDQFPAIRVSWNGKVIKEAQKPFITFGDKSVQYPVNAFLQPGKVGEEILRNLVIEAAADAQHVADLFGGLGNFTYALNADGYDIAGNAIERDLFKKPLTVQNLKKYDCVVMDPPRAGAMAQSKELAKSTVKRVIYVSCNPVTFIRDRAILEQGGYRLDSLTPVDQFVGSSHWELVAVFNRT